MSIVGFCILINNYFFFFQAEDGIRDVERSRGLGVCIRDRTTGVSENSYSVPYNK